MPTQINPALQSDAITMVQKREDTNSLGLLMVENRDKASVTNTPKTPVLTPTTLQSITDLFQADDCLNKLETIERDGFVVPFPPQSQQPQPLQTLTITNKSKKQSFFKLDTGNWTGGTTTVVTPTQTENLTNLDKPRKAMLTRSSSRYVLIFFLSYLVLRRSFLIITSSYYSYQDSLHTHRCSQCRRHCSAVDKDNEEASQCQTNSSGQESSWSEIQTR